MTLAPRLSPPGTTPPGTPAQAAARRLLPGAARLDVAAPHTSNAAAAPTATPAAPAAHNVASRKRKLAASRHCRVTQARRAFSGTGAHPSARALDGSVNSTSTPTPVVPVSLQPRARAGVHSGATSGAPMTSLLSSVSAAVAAVASASGGRRSSPAQPSGVKHVSTLGGNCYAYPNGVPRASPAQLAVRVPPPRHLKSHTRLAAEAAVAAKSSGRRAVPGTPAGSESPAGVAPRSPPKSCLGSRRRRRPTGMRVRFAAGAKAHDGLTLEHRVFDDLVNLFYAGEASRCQHMLEPLALEHAGLLVSLARLTQDLAERLQASPKGTAAVLPSGGGSSARLTRAHLPSLLQLLRKLTEMALEAATHSATPGASPPPAAPAAVSMAKVDAAAAATSSVASKCHVGTGMAMELDLGVDVELDGAADDADLMDLDLDALEDFDLDLDLAFASDWAPDAESATQPTTKMPWVGAGATVMEAAAC